MNRTDIELMFLDLNPCVSLDDLCWRSDGCLDWICGHGLYHTVFAPSSSNFVHSCDGCCVGLNLINGDSMGDA